MSEKILSFKKRVVSPMADFEIAISLDSLLVYLELKPNQPGKMYTSEEVHELLAKEGIAHGVQPEQVDHAVDSFNNLGEIIPPIIVAKGTPSISGKHARVDLNFTIATKAELIEDEDGNIDYRELGLVNNVEKGQLLAKKTPSVEGTPGLDVYGEEVQPPPIREDNFVSGKNTYVSEDKLECYSAIDGQVILKKKMIHVSPIFTVAHDVDFRTGNISFNGSIIINGNVLSGFTVKAKEDITVMGVVEAATLIAGGNIFVKTGFKGGEKGLIKAKGNVTSKFIETGAVECYGNLLIETSIINANVTCYANIQVTRNKGLIVGGDVKCVGDIYCNELGSKLGVTSTITLGDKFIIRQRTEETQEEISNFQNRYAKIKSSLIPIQGMLRNLDALTPDKRAQFEAILQQQDLLKAQIEQLEAKKKKLMTLYNVLCKSKLYVKGYTHSNSSITIGTSKRTFNSPVANSSFYEDPVSKVISIGTYSPPHR